MTARAIDWRRVRYWTEREAVQRGWARAWRRDAKMAACEAGDMVKAEHWRRLARIAAGKAAACRRRVAALVR